MGALSVVMITAVSCALLGVFLVLKNMAMVADALSHTVLLGIVLGYFTDPICGGSPIWCDDCLCH